MDSDGNLWQGAIHQAVQLDILARNPGIIKEVSVVKRSGGIGRIDLVRLYTGECWEIKPSTYYSAGSTQLTNFIRGRVVDRRWNPSLKARRGGYLPRNTFVYNDEYLVNYWYAGNGLILYDYKPLKKTVVREPATAPAPNPSFDEQREYSYAPSYEPSPAEVGLGILGIALFAAAIIFAPASGGASLLLLF